MPASTVDRPVSGVSAGVMGRVENDTIIFIIGLRAVACLT